MAKAMIKLGITGGIGSGKSLVSRILTALGVPIYDSDAESKRLTATDAGIRSQLCSLVGSQVYDAEGRLNKQVLASYLFCSDEHAAQVNAIIHPVVKADFRKWAERRAGEGHPVCAIESAILFEARFLDVVDKVLVVSAPVEVRVERTMRRDQASREAVLARVNRQMDDAERESRADFVIVNDGKRQLIPQVSAVISSLLEK